MAVSTRGLTNDVIFKWYNDVGTAACVDKIFERFPEAARSDTERRSLRSRVCLVAGQLKKIKGDKTDFLKKEFNVPQSLFASSSQHAVSNNGRSGVNNNNDPKEPSLNKDLRPRRTKQVADVDGNDENSNDSWDTSTSRRRGNATRVNYNVKDMITANTKQTLVHDVDGRLVHCGGLDLCDCLESACPGCHNPCLKCESTKCGTECRSRRKWLYEHILVEGTEMKIKNPAPLKGTGKNAA